jgi:hypothetical protein
MLLSYEKDPKGLRDVSRSMQFVLIFSEDWYTCSWQLSVCRKLQFMEPIFSMQQGKCHIDPRK